MRVIYYLSYLYSNDRSISEIAFFCLLLLYPLVFYTVKWNLSDFFFIIMIISPHIILRSINDKKITEKSQNLNNITVKLYLYAAKGLT